MEKIIAFFKKMLALICSFFALIFGGNKPVTPPATEPTEPPAITEPSEPTDPSEPPTEPSEKVQIVDREVLGAGGYGAVFGSQIDPFDQNCFGFICDMGSVYFSYDGGESFERHNIKGSAFDLRFDHSTPGVVWAVGSGVHKSTDHGKTFEMVFPRQEDVYSADHNAENGNYWIFAEDENGVKSDYIPQFQVWSMAINRNSGGKNVYVAQRVSAWDNSKGIYIYKTEDGENFSYLTKLEYCENYKLDYDEVNDCLIVAVAKANDLGYGKIYEIDRSTGEIVFTYDGSVRIHHTSGNVMAFSSAYDKEQNKNTFCFSLSTLVEGKEVVTCYKTNDLRDGSSFIDLTAKLNALKIKDLQVNVGYMYREGWTSEGEIRDMPGNKYYEWLPGGFVLQEFTWDIENTSVLNEDVIYLYHECYVDVKKADNTSYGLNRRTLAYLKYDGSKPENEQFKWVFGLPHKATDKIVNGAWQDGDSGACFGFSSSPQNEDALIFGTYVGIYNTVDGENIYQRQSKVVDSFVELTAKRKDGFTVETGASACKTTGVDVYCTHALATDPFDSNHLLMGCTDFGMLQSFDNGESWIRLLRGWEGDTVKYTEPAYRNTVYDFHFDKEKRDVVYSIWTNVQYAPYAPGGGYLTAKGKFAISYDGGTSWEYISMRSDDNVIPYKMQVVYDGDNRIIYVATANRGFYVSYNGGESFQEFNDGIVPSKLSGQDVIYGNDIAVTPQGIFAIVCGAASSNSSFYKYNEETSRFESIDLPYRMGALRDLEYDAREECLYIGSIARSLDNSTRFIKDGGGVWKYGKDGTFTQVFDKNSSVFSVKLDSTGRLYAVTLQAELVRFEKNNTEYEILCNDLFYFPANLDFGANDEVYVTSWGGGTERIILRSAS